MGLVITINKIDNIHYIAIKFSGRASDSNFGKKQKILEEVIAKNQINIISKNPIYAYYNSPWTLPFLKRNEVLYQIP